MFLTPEAQNHVFWINLQEVKNYLILLQFATNLDYRLSKSASHPPHPSQPPNLNGDLVFVRGTGAKNRHRIHIESEGPRASERAENGIELMAQIGGCYFTCALSEASCEVDSLAVCIGSVKCRQAQKPAISEKFVLLQGSV